MDNSTCSQFIDSVRRADAEAVRKLLHSDSQLANKPLAANPAEQTANKQTPLHLAMPGDGNKLHPAHLEIVQLLIDAGAEVDAVGHGPNHGPCSPLTLAAWGGHAPLVELLLASGADASGLPQTDSQHRPLQTAANHGHAEVAKLLIEAGTQHGLAELLLVGLHEPLKTYLSAHKNVLTQPLADGSYPLHLAVSTTAGTQLLEFLLESGADLTQTDSQGRNPLLKAVESENTEAVAQLKKTHSTDDIFAAAALGDTAAVQDLLQHSPNLARSTHADGVTPLFYAAARWGTLDDIGLLLDNGADIYGGQAIAEERDNGLFAWMCFAGQTAVLEFLLDRGLDLEHPRCRLLLHAACDSGQTELCQRLIEAGICCDTQDKRGRTPRERVLAQGHGNLAALLH